MVAQSNDQSEAVELWNDPGYDVNDCYLEEMETFLNYVREGRVRHEYDAFRATQSLAVVVAALESVKTNRFVTPAALG